MCSFHFCLIFFLNNWIKVTFYEKGNIKIADTSLDHFEKRNVLNIIRTEETPPFFFGVGIYRQKSYNK